MSFSTKIRNKVTSDSDTRRWQGTARNQRKISRASSSFTGTETSKITTRQREIEFSLRDLNKQRADKAGQLALLQQPATPNTRSAIVTVEAAESGPADLQVSYALFPEPDGSPSMMPMPIPTRRRWN